MNEQETLFADREVQSPGRTLSGFQYQDEFLTRSEEEALASELSTLELKPFEFHGHLGNRRVVSFGLKYDFSRRVIEAAADAPSFLDKLLDPVARFSGRKNDEFRQVGVNEYRRGAGIGWHRDKPQFGVIVGISLLAESTMRFRKSQAGQWQRISHVLKPRSIYILSGAARTDWEHSIPPVTDFRYSITFRTLV